MSEQDDKSSGGNIINNIIQFPGFRRQPENKAPLDKSTPPPVPKPQDSKKRKKKASAVLSATVLAVILGTAAVNHYAFEKQFETLEASSNSSSRSIASVERPSWQRDANWEMNLSERLASAQVRDPASNGIGHDATPEEKLRWGTLEEKYTIIYKSDAHEIESILLQDNSTNPSYVLDRNKFLRDYGVLFDGNFASAQLKSVEVSHDKTVEFYTIFDKNRHAQREARFELDIHKRLLSLKMEPVEI